MPVGFLQIGFLQIGFLQGFGVSWEFGIPRSWSVGTIEKLRGWQHLGLGFGAYWVLRMRFIAKDPGS